MQQSIENLFKKHGIFRCRHQAHSRFDYEVSPYHVLKVARCWPEGCVEFLWRCRKFDKGARCPRKFKHVGRQCSSCKYYYDIKKCHSPSSVLDESELRAFVGRLREYEGWLEQVEGKPVRFSGVVESIRPRLIMKIGRHRKSLLMNGNFASFPRGYLGNDLFDDRIYLKLSGNLLRRTGLGPGDEVECDSTFGTERGRVILYNPRRLEIVKNGGSPAVTPSAAEVGRATGRIISGPVNLCKNCPYCCLVDIEETGRNNVSFYRRFYCLRGVSESENCLVRLQGLYRKEENRISTRRF